MIITKGKINTTQQDQELEILGNTEDSLTNEKKRILGYTKKQNEVKAFQSDYRDGPAGRYAEFSTKMRRGFQENNINNQLKDVKHKQDSIKKVKADKLNQQ